MKKITQWYAAGGWLAVLLGLLGFTTGCNEAKEYGTPNADYEVVGTVRLSENGQPLSGVQVRGLIKDPEGKYSSGYYSPQTVTDAEGKFKLCQNTISLYGEIFPLEFSKDGSVRTDTVDISFDQAEFSGGKKWYAGKATRTVEITLDAPLPALAPETTGIPAPTESE